MTEPELETMGNMSLSEPAIFKQMVMKRAVDFRDPNHTKKPNTQIWNSIQSLPKEKL